VGVFHSELEYSFGCRARDPGVAHLCAFPRWQSHGAGLMAAIRHRMPFVFVSSSHDGCRVPDDPLSVVAAVVIASTRSRTAPSQSEMSRSSCAAYTVREHDAAGSVTSRRSRDSAKPSARATRHGAHNGRRLNPIRRINRLRAATAHGMSCVTRPGPDRSRASATGSAWSSPTPPPLVLDIERSCSCLSGGLGVDQVHAF
jgi:hypothetical protein